MTEDDWTAGMPDHPGWYLTFWSDRSKETFEIDEAAIALGYICVDKAVMTAAPRLGLVTELESGI